MKIFQFSRPRAAFLVFLSPIMVFYFHVSFLSMWWKNILYKYNFSHIASEQETDLQLEYLRNNRLSNLKNIYMSGLSV